MKRLESCPDDVNSVAVELSMHTKAEVVQIIGRTIVFYRHSPQGIYRLP